MIGFAAPAWLLGLLLVPLIWYLHRSGPSLRRVPVASLELWRNSPAIAAHAGRERRPDPAWRRRAAIAALLSMALAAPQWQRATPRVTVWLDDSLSMRVRDAGRMHLQQGIELAQAAAREAAAHDVVVRPLSDPARSYPRLDLAPLEPQQGTATTPEPSPPPAVALRPDHVHWLVTDGADATLNAWAAEAPFSRVLQVTGATRNVGISRLSARQQPGEPGRLAIQLRIVNGGDRRESRTVELTAGSTTLGSRSVELEPGAAVTLDFSAANAVPTVTARLSPEDALAEDDVFALELTGIAPLSVTLADSCPQSLARAVRTHPAFEVTRGRPTRLMIDCSGTDTPRQVPSIRFVAGLPDAIDTTVLAWSTAATPLRERLAGRLPSRAAGSLAALGAGDRVLLAIGEKPLIVVRGGTPRRVETTLDVTAPGFESGPGLPLLLGALADIAFETQLLARIATADRGDQASRVVPQPGLITVKRSNAKAVAVELSIAPLLLLALALLAWDALLAGRRLLRERGPAPGRAA